MENPAASKFCNADVQLSIVGYNGSTEIASLSEAFQTLDIGVVLPGLNTTLLNQAALESQSKFYNQ